ncbi:glycosyltransferase [Altererythrobacter sp. CC-YST694]|uniref:glycosyltransferase n=1 Tax=Altererythrobacter sp. CC-YST694 TaxID=2755038 RepID=UPI001D029246|nr:glycosyltransferase [Altererythrobacter sp. CC-YST694]MCB5424031.1 glycosyltransferase [Altererythrobacter sp. CC-YST694]
MIPHRILHLHSSFDAGGKELRCVRLINAFGAEFSHSIVSAQPGALAAAKHISPDISVDYPTDFPPLAGSPSLGRLRTLARAMREFDLVLTYNWGAMDAAMAHGLFAHSMKLPSLIHHEDGFNSDEAIRLKTRRNLYRRLALRRASALVVPSHRLERIALDVWRQPAARVHRIANGIPTGAYAALPARDAIPGLVKGAGDKWLGTLAGLRAVKDLPAMVRAFARLPADWRLVILGEGPERQAILAEAQAMGVAERLHLPGFAADPAKVVGLFDIFALSSRSEQFPISVVEAMAAGLPVAAPAVGDVAQMVAQENAPFIVPAGDTDALGQAFVTLAADPQLRRAVGGANQAKARDSCDERVMLSAYHALYAGAMRPVRRA